MSDLKFSPLTPTFAAEMTGLDLHRRPADSLVERVDQAMAQYAVLVVHGQSINEDEHIDFSRAFGELDMGFAPIFGKARSGRLKYVEFADVSNVDAEGNVATSESRRVVAHYANQLWHSDASFQSPSASYSMLQAVAIPSHGGNTEYADMRAAYDDLDAGLKRQLDGLTTEHYALHSRFALGDDDYTDEQRNALPPVQWPLVRTHPISGRKSLFIGAHASHVVVEKDGVAGLLADFADPRDATTPSDFEK